MKTYFMDEVAKTIEDINKIRRPGDLCFAAVSDTRLIDACTQNRENIRAVDREVHFDFLVHLGDVLCDRNPEKISRRFLREELSNYRNSIASQKLYVVQGELDGWRDESYRGQLVTGIMTDEIWHQDTGFIDEYEGVTRMADAPYYYVDDPKHCTRCIFLCSNRYQIKEDHKLFQKYHTLGLEQIAWLEEALKPKQGWNVLLFSHDIPQSVFETGKNSPSYKGNAIDMTMAVLQDAVRNGEIDFVAWITGHYGYDCEVQELSMNLMTMGGLACFPCPGVETESVRRGMPRTMGTYKEDLWDAFVLRPQERKLYVFRFGAGEDRVIVY